MKIICVTFFLHRSSDKNPVEIRDMLKRLRRQFTGSDDGRTSVRERGGIWDEETSDDNDEEGPTLVTVDDGRGGIKHIKVMG